jgi:hypothetical protein
MTSSCSPWGWLISQNHQNPAVRPKAHESAVGWVEEIARTVGLWPVRPSLLLPAKREGRLVRSKASVYSDEPPWAVGRSPGCAPSRLRWPPFEGLGKIYKSPWLHSGGGVMVEEKGWEKGWVVTSLAGANHINSLSNIFLIKRNYTLPSPNVFSSPHNLMQRSRPTWKIGIAYVVDGCYWAFLLRWASYNYS